MIIAAALVLAVVLGACHSGGESGLVEQSDVPPSPLELAEERVESFATGLTSAVSARADAVPAPTVGEAFQNGSHALAALESPYRELVTELYEERGFAPVFVVDGALTPAGETVLETLEDSWAHGLWPRDYGVETVRDALGAIDDARRTRATDTPVVLGPAEREALAEAIARRPDLLEREDGQITVPVLDLILNPTDGYSPAPSVAAAYNDRVSATMAAGDAAIEAELALAAGFLRYSWDMRYANPHWFDEALGEDPVALEAAQHAAMEDAFRRGVQAGFGDVLAALPPAYEQYGRLVQAHRQYRAFVEAGGWRTDLEPADLRLGREDDMVPRLRERLAAEGYFEGDLTSREYDRELRDAFEHYQLTHQFDDDGELSEGEVSSLNTPALQRAQQIAVTLQRWRESWITEDQTFIFVNVPDFYAEAWRDGHRDLRFRIIVGSTQRVRLRSTGELTYWRATPDVHEPMRYIVFNPYWNVPQQIMENEYDPNLVENPNWYEENGYEVLFNERGIRWVRQLPGPANALGVVKFLFPNEHDVYLHDTPMRRLFERTQRTFSHGCMRVENPMEFAYYLLEHDRGWDRERVDEERGLLEDGTLPDPLPPELYDRWISLRTPIPVHVEYYVVRVDDDGFTNFDGDIYRRDVPRMEARARREVEEAERVVSERIADGLGRAAVTARHSANEAAQSPRNEVDEGGHTDVIEADEAHVAAE